MAVISAWAVGSRVEVTRLVPSARMAPLLTTTAPKGPPRRALTFSIASSMARCMKWFCIPGYFPYCKPHSGGCCGNNAGNTSLKYRRFGEEAQHQERFCLEIIEEAELHNGLIELNEFQTQ